jgi:hypothetical protein
MPSDVPSHLSSPAGRRAANDELGRLIRDREFSVAEGVLVACLTEFPGPIATASRGIPADQVEVSGWAEAAAGLREAAELGIAITAVGLDLSNYSDSDGAEWWDKEPVVEVTWYDDSVFAFSGASRRHLLDACKLSPLPWTGAGAPGDPGELTVTGLRSLNGALLQAGREQPWSFGAGEEPVDEKVAKLLGGWFLHLRFHQAVHRHLAEHGAALGVPVLVGQHAVGPAFVSAYLPGDKPTETERGGTRALLERARLFRRRGQQLAEATTKTGGLELEVS